MRGPSFSAALLAVLTGAFAALDAGVARGEADRDVASVFLVAKSENRNQVHYGVRLDAACAPVGAAPVFAYWRMLEQGPRATEPLLARELGAYGLAEQRVVERGAEGGRVTLRLRALPARAIAIETRSRGGACEATATTVIGGEPASLWSVYAQLRWPFGVDHLTLSGRALRDGRVVEERVAP
ncbi:MAG TPA: DUF4833 domain-containing protein [Polyangiaceae bacterium]|jgi:hypothetical protein